MIEFPNNFNIRLTYEKQKEKCFDVTAHNKNVGDILLNDDAINQYKDYILSYCNIDDYADDTVSFRMGRVSANKNIQLSIWGKTVITLSENKYICRLYKDVNLNYECTKIIYDIDFLITDEIIAIEEIIMYNLTLLNNHGSLNNHSFIFVTDNKLIFNRSWNIIIPIEYEQ